MKMGAEEEKIKEYLGKIAELKFSYVNFEANSILWIAASVNGEKIVYINDNFQRAVDNINIRPEDFRAIARERYQIDLANLQEMARKARKNIISEIDWRTADSAYMKASKLSDSPNVSKYERERRKNQADLFSKYAYDQCDKQYGVDKIKQRKAQHNTDLALGLTKEPFKYTNGDLKRLDRQSNDTNDYFSGKQAYKNGKWVNNESKKNTKINKQIIRLTESDLHRIIKESVKRYLNEWGRMESDLDADEIYGDKAERMDRFNRREKMMQDDWEMRNRRLRQKYPGKSDEWYEAMIDTFYENRKSRSTINEIGDAPRGK